jgi:hypothetical protein
MNYTQFIKQEQEKQRQALKEFEEQQSKQHEQELNELYLEQMHNIGIEVRL